MDETTPPGLGPLPAADWGDAEYDAFGTLIGVPGDKVPRAGSGHRFDPLNFDVIGVLAHHPELAAAFLGFNGFLLQRGALPARLRELAILRVAASRRSAYEWAEHVRAALGLGVTNDEIEQLAAGNDGFDGDDRTVLETTDALLAAGQLDDGTWARLADELGTKAAMELLFVVGTYQLLAMTLDTWGLRPDPDAPELPPA